jgi:hypothetical protein
MRPLEMRLPAVAAGATTGPRAVLNQVANARSFDAARICTQFAYMAHLAKSV